MTLRRADNARLTSHKRFTGKVDLFLEVGRKQYPIARKLPSTAVEEWVQQARQAPIPVRIADPPRVYWNFADRWWWDNDGLNVQQVHALLVTQLQRQQARIERAEAMVAMGERPHEAVRGQIPDDVKQLVWMRDGGRCRNCGAQTELQFDHVIPVALGGATVAENLQILCGPCNRRKSAGLTVR